MLVGQRLTRRSFIDLVSEYEEYRAQTLNLIPSENIISPGVSKVLGSSMAGRYAGMPESYGGTGVFHEIWKKSEDIATIVFGCKRASVVPVSGHIAGMIALDRLCHRGETIATISASVGGYKGYTQGCIPDVLGLKVAYLPFDRKRFNIDTDKSVKMIREKKPAVVILGATVFLFPHPVKELSEAAHSYGGKVIYDGSHVLGLIAGKEFQRPLAEGADVMLGSTHKTLFGPQGGIILSDDSPFMNGVEENYLYRFIDNFHLNRVAGLGVALEEIKACGPEYARKVVQNSKALANELDSLGLPVAGKEANFTRSHQVLLNYGDRGSFVRDTLESNGIIVDSRVRLGTSEVTRRGMGMHQMREIGRLVLRGLAKRNDQAVKKEVLRLVANYRKIKYTLGS